MDEIDARIQELNKEIERLKIRNAELEQLHFADQAEIVYQRRQMDVDGGRSDG